MYKIINCTWTGEIGVNVKTLIKLLLLKITDVIIPIYEESILFYVDFSVLK